MDAPSMEAGTVGRAFDLFAFFAVGTVVVSAITAVVILYIVFRAEWEDNK